MSSLVVEINDIVKILHVILGRTMEELVINKLSTTHKIF